MVVAEAYPEEGVLMETFIIVFSFSWYHPHLHQKTIRFHCFYYYFKVIEIMQHSLLL